MSAAGPSQGARPLGGAARSDARGGRTSGFVVDASVTGAWFFEDETTAFTEQALTRSVAEDAWVPNLWLLECANLLTMAQRKGRLDLATKKRLVERAMALPLLIDSEPVSIAQLESLASAYALSAYDACYLELAIRRALPLLTLDRQLLRAAKAAGHPVETARGG